MAESPANLENPSPNFVLGLSSECPRTTRTLGPNSDSPQTILGLSEHSLFYSIFTIIIIIIYFVYLNKKQTPGFEPQVYK